MNVLTMAVKIYIELMHNYTTLNYVLYSARERLQSKNDSLSILSNSSGVVEESQAGL